MGHGLYQFILHPFGTLEKKNVENRVVRCAELRFG